MIATVIRASSCANLAPAWARQDHTTSPSANTAARLMARSRPLHPLPNVRDDRDTSLMRAGITRVNHNFRKNENEIFLRKALDNPNQIETVHEIGFCARPVEEAPKRRERSHPAEKAGLLPLQRACSSELERAPFRPAWGPATFRPSGRAQKSRGCAECRASPDQNP